MDLVVHEVGEFQDVHVAHHDRVVEGLTGPADPTSEEPADGDEDEDEDEVIEDGDEDAVDLDVVAAAGVLGTEDSLDDLGIEIDLDSLDADDALDGDDDIDDVVAIDEESA